VKFKQVLFFRLILFSLLLLSFNAESQEKIVEEVEVVNVEVVVRVYHEGKPEPVGGLKKRDFKLIVDGKEKEIHGFFEVRKKISSPPSFTPRLFVLIFNIHTCSDQMKESLDSVFQKVIRSNDRIMVFTNQSLLNERNVGDLDKMKAQVLGMLEVQSNEMKKKIRQMEMDIHLLASDCGNIKDSGYYTYRYEQIKREFLQSYFNPGVKEYAAIAEYLGEKKNKKWIIIFYQLGMFPDFAKKPGGLPEDINTRLFKSISKSFINTGATVHTLLMLPPRVKGNLPEGFEYQLNTVHSEIILRDITKLTGGRVMQTTNINKFVKKISEKEDIYYVLTFDPKELKGKKYKLEIQTGDSRNRLVYDNAGRSGDFIKQLGMIDEDKVKSQAVDLNVIFYDNRGLDLAKEGRYEEAVSYFTKAVRFDPGSAHLYFNRGLTYYKMKQLDKALADYSVALELTPQYADACYNRGLIFLQKKEFGKAVSDFTRVIALEPNHGYARYYRAITFEKAGQIQKALQDYKAIKQVDPVFYSVRFSEIKDKIKELEDRIEYE
jgi:tetratricopeptide (TPR) repeat protein